MLTRWEKNECQWPRALGCCPCQRGISVAPWGHRGAQGLLDQEGGGGSGWARGEAEDAGGGYDVGPGFCPRRLARAGGVAVGR